MVAKRGWRSCGRFNPSDSRKIADGPQIWERKKVVRLLFKISWVKIRRFWGKFELDLSMHQPNWASSSCGWFYQSILEKIANGCQIYASKKSESQSSQKNQHRKSHLKKLPFYEWNWSLMVPKLLDIMGNHLMLKNTTIIQRMNEFSPQ